MVKTPWPRALKLVSSINSTYEVKRTEGQYVAAVEFHRSECRVFHLVHHLSILEESINYGSYMTRKTTDRSSVKHTHALAHFHLQEDQGVE